MSSSGEQQQQQQERGPGGGRAGEQGNWAWGWVERGRFGCWLAVTWPACAAQLYGFTSPEDAAVDGTGGGGALGQATASLSSLRSALGNQGLSFFLGPSGGDVWLRARLAHVGRGSRGYHWNPQVRVACGWLLCTGKVDLRCPCLARTAVVKAGETLPCVKAAWGLTRHLGGTVSVTLLVTVGADRHMPACWMTGRGLAVLCEHGLARQAARMCQGDVPVLRRRARVSAEH